MPISVRAVSDADFKTWVEQEKKSADAGAPNGAGTRLMAANTEAPIGDQHGIQR
jgi:heme/copper-type cytochrome/quinol oxidase subunit 2